MIPYTAADSLKAIARTFGLDAIARPSDGIALAPHRKRPITASALRDLAAHTTGDARLDAERLAATLSSGPAIGAWEGQRLVGFIRAVSDGRLSAYVEDAQIDDCYRDRGLGRALWQRLLAELHGVAVITVQGAAGSVPYSEKEGFQPVPTQLLQRTRR